ncbi:MAG: hypothetical protein JRC68_06210 [Deltaproteobacteria bacterium]|nr:hypothetical protein [Deltaproteobacteria bacterium]
MVGPPGAGKTMLTRLLYPPSQNTPCCARG